MIRRPSSESPIVRWMVQEGVDEAKIAAYAAKVDAFNEGGAVMITELPYEGPDVSPGADRPNSMKGVPRAIMQPLYDDSGEKLFGRRATILPT